MCLKNESKLTQTEQVSSPSLGTTLQSEESVGQPRLHQQVHKLRTHQHHSTNTTVQAILARDASLDFDPSFTLVSHFCNCSGTKSEWLEPELCLHLSPEHSGSGQFIATASISISKQIFQLLLKTLCISSTSKILRTLP